MVNVMATIGEVANSGTPAVLAALTNGGLTAATRSLAIEYAAYGIRVNAISGRVGQVSDVVDGVLLLKSSPGITGKILRIDGTPNGQPRAVKPLIRPSGRLARAAPARRAARGGSLCRAW